MQTVRRATEIVASAAGLYRELVVSSLKIVPQLRELTRNERRSGAPDLRAPLGAPPVGRTV